LFLPSGGGKWVVEAPYLLEAANQLHVNLAWMVMVYNAAEALRTSSIRSGVLPLMGLTGVKAAI
jgi:short-chain fatty acids transporter